MGTILQQRLKSVFRPVICVSAMTALGACASLDVKSKYQPP